MTDRTDFGYEQVPVEDKAQRVRRVFDSVAGKYDLMNDLMSAGLHRLWKRFAVERDPRAPGMRVLDLAGGTGDLAVDFARRVGPDGEVVLTDINGTMLAGRAATASSTPASSCPWYSATRNELPFPDAHFDCVSIGFGLRNVTRKDECARRDAARAAGRAGSPRCSEFSRVWQPLAPAYDWYSFSVLPRLGQFAAGDGASYRYLAESIRMHPDQATLKTVMEESGFDRVDFHNLTAGVVALHLGYRF